MSEEKRHDIFDRLVRRAKEHARNEDDPMCLTFFELPATSGWADALYLSDEVDALAHVPGRQSVVAAAGLYAARALSSYLNQVNAARALCESPIEMAMFDALCMIAEQFGFDVCFVRDVSDWTAAKPYCVSNAKPDRLVIFPQLSLLDRYRVDFLLVQHGYDTATKSERLYTDAPVVVECDGHDFHERTKQQAKRDRSRDRALSAAGFQVLRYTGHEIWDDAIACAYEAVRILAKTVRLRRGFTS